MLFSTCICLYTASSALPGHSAVVNNLITTTLSLAYFIHANSTHLQLEESNLSLILIAAISVQPLQHCFISMLFIILRPLCRGLQLSHAKKYKIKMSLILPKQGSWSLITDVIISLLNKWSAFSFSVSLLTCILVSVFRCCCSGQRPFDHEISQ